MITYKITSGINLNNRNAFDIINILRNFDGAVYIEKLSEQRRVNAKSLLELLSINVNCGDEISIIAHDTLSEEAVSSIKNVFGN